MDIETKISLDNGRIILTDSSIIPSDVRVYKLTREGRRKVGDYLSTYGLEGLSTRGLKKGSDLRLVGIIPYVRENA